MQEVFRDFNIRFIKFKTEEYRQLLYLRNEILRIPIGLLLTPEDIENEKEDIFIGVFTKDDQLAGCCILSITAEKDTLKLRQMAVADDFQKSGLGTGLLHFVEKWAQKKKYRKIILHARKIAVYFYIKNGYQTEGDEFVEVNIPHFKMWKQIID